MKHAMIRCLGALCAFSFAATAGCADELDRLSLLDDLRVLTILATPQEVVPGEQITLTPVVWAPPGTDVTATWSVCPLTLGPDAGFACAVPECEAELPAEADGRLVTTPSETLLACLETLAASGAGEDVTEDAPESLEVAYRYDVVTGDGFARTAYRRVAVWLEGEPPARNAPPVIDRVEARAVGDEAWTSIAELPAVPRGGELEVRVRLTEDSAERYPNALGETVTEAPFTTCFATAGRFDADRASGLEAVNTWTAEELAPGDDAAEIWVVAHDGRGAAAVGGPFVVTIGVD